MTALNLTDKDMTPPSFANNTSFANTFIVRTGRDPRFHEIEVARQLRPDECASHRRGDARSPCGIVAHQRQLPIGRRFMSFFTYGRDRQMNPKNTRDEVRIMTLQAHILGEQAKHPHASGTFSWILSALSISAKIIADKVRRARLENVLGSAGTENVQGRSEERRV